MTHTSEVAEEDVEVHHLDGTPPRQTAAPSAVPRIPQGTPSISRSASGNDQVGSGYINQDPVDLTNDAYADDVPVGAENSGASNSGSGVVGAPVGSSGSESTVGGFKKSNLFKRSSSFEPEVSECPICFDDLCTEPLAIMLSGRPPPSPSPGQKGSGQKIAKRPPRSCRHFLHHRCLAQVQKNLVSECPLCRTSFVSFIELVDIRLDPRTWFSQVSMTGEHSLKQQEIVDALSAVLPVDSELLAQEVREKWGTWTPSQCGSMTLEEFVEPRRGMLQWVLYNMDKLGASRQGQEAPTRSAHIPDIIANKESWFRYWDIDSKHALTFNQLLRGLVKTFRLEGNVDIMFALRQSLASIWKDFGLEGRRNVSLALFVEQDTGLLDTLTMQWKSAIGPDAFNSLLRQSRVYEMPVSDLKRALVRLGRDPTSAVEKSELVAMLIEAEAQAASRKPPPDRKRSREAFDSEDAARQKLRDSFAGLSISELKRRLHSKGVSCENCVMKEELVDLLLMYANKPNMSRAQPKSATYTNGRSSASSTYPRQQPRTPPPSSNTFTNAQGNLMRRVVCGSCQTAQDIPGNTDVFQCYKCRQTLRITPGTGTSTRRKRDKFKKADGSCCCM